MTQCNLVHKYHVLEVITAFIFRVKAILASKDIGRDRTETEALSEPIKMLENTVRLKGPV